MNHRSTMTPRRRRGIRLTVASAVLIALGIYLGFILLLGSR
ncbi:MAG: hypothetical protein R3202_02085 [Candidatus Competibacterales bacterium]|nr:hypothetical protein [Candidatus Competibacterales bacterium]